MLDATTAHRHIDPIIEHCKQFVDRAKLRENLKVSVDLRLRRLRECSAASYRRRRSPSPDGSWEPVSDCSSDRQSDPITELYKRDVDRTLLRENLRLTPDERLAKLASFVRFIDELRSTRTRHRETA